MPFGVSSGIPNVIIHAKFHVDRLRGFLAAGPPKVPFPILIGTTLTTVLHYRADCDMVDQTRPMLVTASETQAPTRFISDMTDGQMIWPHSCRGISMKKLILRIWLRLVVGYSSLILLDSDSAIVKPSFCSCQCKNGLFQH